MAPDAEHVHPDDLALLALGEQAELDRTHLSACALCRDEVDQLRRVVTSARTVTADDTAVAPPARVWDAVAAELGLDGSASPQTDGVATVVALTRPQRRTALLVAAAALVGVLVGSVVTGLVLAGGDDGGGVVASADLAALPEHQGTGAAEVVGTGDNRELRLDVTGLTTGDGFYEVWLLGADGKRLVSLGLLDGSTASFPLPSQVDLADFPVVDVSLEPADGNPAHSGDSIVRGTLSS